MKSIEHIEEHGFPRDRFFWWKVWQNNMTHETSFWTTSTGHASGCVSKLAASKACWMFLIFSTRIKSNPIVPSKRHQPLAHRRQVAQSKLRSLLCCWLWRCQTFPPQTKTSQKFWHKEHDNNNQKAFLQISKDSNSFGDGRDGMKNYPVRSLLKLLRSSLGPKPNRINADLSWKFEIVF